MRAPKAPRRKTVALASRPARAVESVRHTQAERRETAEAAIIAAATRIIAERGIDELTLTEAGEAAGYSRALPAHYFGSKGALLTALADHVVESFAYRVRSHVTTQGGLKELLQRIAYYIEDGTSDPMKLRAYQAILGAGLTRPELAPLVTRLNRESIDGIATLIKQAREAGEIRADARPRAEASIILAAMRGVMFQWLIDSSQAPLSRVKECLLASIRKSLVP